jgi:transcriptional regulator with XRE-family HTH domain
VIRNRNQLNQARNRLNDVLREVESLSRDYSGMEQEILRTPLIHEIEELREEIAEFQELSQSTLDEATQGILQKPMLLDQIGELLTKLRIAAGFTQAELAARLGWQQPNLSRFESENYNSQTIAKVVEYADSLGVWLHVVPSLTEKPPEVIYTSTYVRITPKEWASTSAGFHEIESMTDSFDMVRQPMGESHDQQYDVLFRPAKQPTAA